MRRLTKLIREAKKLSIHCRKNMNLKSTYEPIQGWIAESHALRIKKSVKKDSRGQRTKVC